MLARNERTPDILYSVENLLMFRCAIGCFLPDDRLVLVVSNSYIAVYDRNNNLESYAALPLEGEISSIIALEPYTLAWIREDKGVYTYDLTTANEQPRVALNFVAENRYSNFIEIVALNDNGVMLRTNKDLRIYQNLDIDQPDYIIVEPPMTFGAEKPMLALPNQEFFSCGFVEVDNNQYRLYLYVRNLQDGAVLKEIPCAQITQERTCGHGGFSMDHIDRMLLCDGASVVALQWCSSIIIHRLGTETVELYRPDRGAGRNGVPLDLLEFRRYVTNQLHLEVCSANPMGGYILK